MTHARGPLAAVTTALTTAVALTLASCGSSDSGSGDSSTPPRAAPSSSAPPSPSRSYPLSEAPRTIPSVREHTAARGPGWKPAPSAGVVVGSGRLADEGRLIAEELGLRYRGGADARDGDVELGLATGKKGPAESYTLTTRDGRVTITGADEAGAFYGTRTLKQSVEADGVMPEGVVKDRPGKPQRGFNLDIARKPYEAGWIEDRLREMADLKMNQFGLHFSDDQAFRIESKKHPEVVAADHLTQAEVRKIVALASRLHIDVVPEIDSPGHLGAVLDAHPGLQLRNTRGVASPGSLDISKPGAATLIDELLDEYTDLFGGAYWHLGADEYQALTVSDPSASYPQLANAAREKYGSGATIEDLATGWLNDRADTVRPKGMTAKAWNDGMFSGGSVQADKDIEVEYWTGKEIGAREPEAYLKEGRNLVNLNDEFLYYVLGEPNTFVYPTGERIYAQWTPQVLRGTTPVSARYSDQILGGRFAVWGDLPNAQTTAQVAEGIRMPLYATAQKLWDPTDPTLSWAQFRALAGEIDGRG
ncbi:glycoside hydrolase family 20 protein [uncultured Streptomyces sp.]|uniref:beta-N-acetylhexosaminidase n=1 Tax=uncultured Streptomyces sp. TaxID=174707 RepID=UPI002607660D|nr:glycoside hydrolase family 20 protein [uncultured Streptomyces sp.]